MLAIKCCRHLLSNNPGNIRTITGKTLENFKKCLEIWQSSEKQPEQSLASMVSPIIECAYIHKACYSRFTDKKKLSNAQKRAKATVQVSCVSSQQRIFLQLHWFIHIFLCVLYLFSQLTHLTRQNCNWNSNKQRGFG